MTWAFVTFVLLAAAWAARVELRLRQTLRGNDLADNLERMLAQIAVEFTASPRAAKCDEETSPS